MCIKMLTRDVIDGLKLFSYSNIPEKDTLHDIMSM